MSDPQTKLGQIIDGEQMRDAVHIAVAPVVAGHDITPGAAISLAGNIAMTNKPNSIGIADPFLANVIRRGEKFWLFLYPNTITSLKHVWTHPAFEVEPAREPTKSASERWMREWAVKHMSEDYYGDDGKRSDESAYASAINAGHSHRVGPYEDARDHIDDEWWSHWEAITGQCGDRDTYFSCAC